MTEPAGTSNGGRAVGRSGRRSGGGSGGRAAPWAALWPGGAARCAGGAALVASLLGAAVLVESPPAGASVTTYFASPGASGTTCSNTTPCSLNQALSDAASGTASVIDLESGTYSGPFVVSGSSTTTVTMQLAPGATGAALSGSGTAGAAVLGVDSGVSATIDGITVENGDNSSGVTGGGGIANSGTLVVEDSTISGNTSSSGAGGGIFNQGTLVVEDSTISGNTASAGSGGIGGGIANSGTLVVEDSTITGNTATTGNGAGIDANSGSSVSLAATIIAKQASGGDCAGSGTFTDSGYNVEGPSGGCGFSSTGNASGSVQSSAIDSYLGTLGNYGGPTETVPLVALPSPSTTSADPAASTVPAGFALPTPVNGVSLACSIPDQRGVPRSIYVICDVGAFEAVVRYASPSGSAAVPCYNRSSPCSLAMALSEGIPGYSVDLETGTYQGGITLSTSVTLQLAPGATGAALSGSGTADGAVLGVGSGVSATIDGITVENGTNSAGVTAGGGIYNLGTLVVEDSTISGNAVGTNTVGGGVFNRGTLVVEDSTISGNTTPTQGGGIANDGTLVVEDSTISGNTAEVGQYGGGIFNLSGSVTLAATIIAKQVSGGDCTASAFARAITDSGYNVEGPSGGCGFSGTGNASGSVQSSAIDSYLGTLGNYGGPTETVPLVALPSPSTTSADPAAGAIPAAFVLPTPVNSVGLACSIPDQRGVPRSNPCNVGAFESVPTTTSLVATPPNPVAGEVVTFVAAVSPAQATATAGTVSFTGPSGTSLPCTSASASFDGTTATCVVTATGALAGTISSAYSGGIFSLGSSGSTSLAVTAASTSTTLLASSTAPAYGQDVTFSAVVSVVPPGGLPPSGWASAGNVAFDTGGSAIPGCSAVSPAASGSGSGSTALASCATSSLPSGSDTVTAAFSPAASLAGYYLPSSDQLALDVGTPPTPQPPPPAPPAPAVSSVSPSSGPSAGGTLVTITGNDLSGASAVGFGSTPAAGYAVDSAGEITALSPPGIALSTVDVTVTTAGGTSAASRADHFSYLAAPLSEGYHPITPTRICDTRPGNPSGLSGEALANCEGFAPGAGQILTIQVTGLAGVPSDASAVAIDLIATDPTSGGYLSAYPAGEARPGGSSLDFTRGSDIAKLVVAGLSPGGEVSIYNSAGQTGVVVDVQGYVAPEQATGAGLYVPVPPTLVCNTAAGNPSGLTGSVAQCNGDGAGGSTPSSPATTLSIQVAGVGGLPTTGLAAVMLDITASGFETPGYVSAYAPGGSVPMSSVLDFSPGEGAVWNTAIVPVGSSGTVDLLRSAATNLRVAVLGYVSAPGGTGATMVTLADPRRIADTRCSASPPPAFCTAEALPSPNASLGALAAGVPESIQATGIAGVPTDATALIVNVTVTGTTALSDLTAPSSTSSFSTGPSSTGPSSTGPSSTGPSSTGPSSTGEPAGTTQPSYAVLGWQPGQTASLSAIVPIGTGGQISFSNEAGSAELIVDVVGYLAPLG